jgi:hypothetical protein
MKRPWLYYFSPFILAAIASLIPLGQGLAEINKHESFGVIEVFIFGVGLLLLFGVDYIIKSSTNGRILYIWIIEAIIIVSLYFLVIYGSNLRLSGC